MQEKLENVHYVFFSSATKIEFFESALKNSLEYNTYASAQKVSYLIQSLWKVVSKLWWPCNWLDIFW